MVTFKFQKYNATNVSTKTHPFIFHIIIMKLTDTLPGPGCVSWIVSCFSTAEHTGKAIWGSQIWNQTTRQHTASGLHVCPLPFGRIREGSLDHQSLRILCYLALSIHWVQTLFPLLNLGSRQVSTLSNDKLTNQKGGVVTERQAAVLLLPRIPLTPHQRHRNPAKLCWQKLILRRTLINARF